MCWDRIYGRYVRGDIESVLLILMWYNINIGDGNK